MSRQGGQLRRFGQLFLGALTGDRETVREAFVDGNTEAIDDIADQGEEVIAEVGSRAERIARHEPRPRTVLNAGRRPSLRQKIDPPVEVVAEVVADGDDCFAPAPARRASR